jgi:hypothetical protein
MLSLERCRTVLGDDSPTSAADLALLRDHMYALANVAFDVFESRSRKPEAPALTGDNGENPSARGFEAALELIPEADRSSVEERAAIKEFDGGVERSEAERTAVYELALKHGRKGKWLH